MMRNISLVITIENTHTQLILPCAISGIRAIKKQKTELADSFLHTSPFISTEETDLDLCGRLMSSFYESLKKGDSVFTLWLFNIAMENPL